ncbi:MAG: hypothetical protein HY789_00020 [Deltaproteobacteria bacterium]|nr:hypothetical protein [Deltaproteobacteria bacterium]
MLKKKGSLDYYLILATVAVLFIISAICIYGMFSFKLGRVHQLAPAAKLVYMNRMNSVTAPFIIALIVLLGICVPKRLLSERWLGRFAAALAMTAGAASLWLGVKAGLVVVLVASLQLQLVVLVLAAGGSQSLHFERSGYWVRLGSSLMHLGIILFVLDLFFYQYQLLHLILFWVTTGAVVLGMIFCFYAQSVIAVIRRIRHDAR